MSFTETQLPGLRVHVGEGEAYPYAVPFASSALVSPIPGMNIDTILPAGTVVDIAGHLYRTVRQLGSQTVGPQVGAIAPLGPRRPSVIGPKDNSTFTDRANVYWDATNNCFTATVGSNVKVGLAVSNGELGSATNGTASTIAYTNQSTFPPDGQGTSVTGLTEYNASATIIGGTSADGLVGAYASGDAFMEVELIGT